MNTRASSVTDKGRWRLLSSWQLCQGSRRSRPSVTSCRWMSSAFSWTVAGMRTFRWRSLKPWNGNCFVLVLSSGALLSQICCYLTQGVLPHAVTYIRLTLCCSRTLTPSTLELCHTLWGSWVWIAPSTQPFLSTKWAKCLCMISIRYGETLCTHYTNLSWGWTIIAKQQWSHFHITSEWTLHYWTRETQSCLM